MGAKRTKSGLKIVKFDLLNLILESETSLFWITVFYKGYIKNNEWLTFCGLIFEFLRFIGLVLLNLADKKVTVFLS